MDTEIKTKLNYQFLDNTLTKTNDLKTTERKQDYRTKVFNPGGGGGGTSTSFVRGCVATGLEN